MATCECFQCKKGYDSKNPDDIAGDGKCFACNERSKKLAFKIDIEMAERRKNNPIPESNIRKFFTEEQILKGEIAGSPRINFKDLGIQFSD